ncbi:hypothetical protein D3C86_1429820 [compost metagenome]
MAPVTGSIVTVPFEGWSTTVTLVLSRFPSGSLSLEGTLITTGVSSLVVATSPFAVGGQFVTVTGKVMCVGLFSHGFNGFVPSVTSVLFVTPSPSQSALFHAFVGITL